MSACSWRDVVCAAIVVARRHPYATDAAVKLRCAPNYSIFPPRTPISEQTNVSQVSARCGAMTHFASERMLHDLSLHVGRCADRNIGWHTLAFEFRQRSFQSPHFRFACRLRRRRFRLCAGRLRYGKRRVSAELRNVFFVAAQRVASATGECFGFVLLHTNKRARSSVQQTHNILSAVHSFACVVECCQYRTQCGKTAAPFCLAEKATKNAYSSRTVSSGMSSLPAINCIKSSPVERAST